MTSQTLACERAAFYLCLARAFAAPTQPGSFEALRDALPADLEALAAECGYPAGEAVTELRASMAGSDARSLLVAYSRLFLIPGDKHPSLNAGAYIDGAVAGGSAHAMELCYRRCGLEKEGGFGDLPDHVSVQLEFVAWLLAAEAEAEAGVAERPPVGAEEFLRTFVARWAAPLRAEIESAMRRFELVPHPYAALARLVEVAVAHDVAGEAAPRAPEEEIDPEIVRLRAQFAGRTMSEDDLSVIRTRLAADGLPADHVAIPVDERDRVMGLAAMRPPELPGKRGLYSD